MKRFSCSLCISTYNWPAALELCLLSVKRQTVLPDEIIICDDGSGNETRELITRLAADLPVPVEHVWQPDEGFKKTRILNKGLAKVKCDYIIEIDGDIIMHERFIEDHLRFAKQGTFVCGVRTMFTEDATREIITKKLVDPSPLAANAEKRYNGLRSMPLAYLNYLVQRGSSQMKYAIGANIAFFREDAMKVNGYNESFSGWGKEDNEFALRLCNAGIGIRFVKFAAIAYHLYHREASRGRMAENEQMLEETKKNKLIFAEKGISQYLN